MTSRPIRFHHRGAIVCVADAEPTRTVLEWLREDARCTGTKEGCAEGDCGACTVVVGELADSQGTAGLPVVGGLALRSVNACIQFLPTLDGKALFTVEDLRTISAGALHPVQQAMVECHGSQCGFCTPGFVMSLWTTYERHAGQGTRPARGELADDLAGNLCRCTGYRPILDAGQRMFELAPAPLDAQPVVQALRALASDPPLDYRGRYFAPRTLDELAALRLARPDARLLAGATDVGLWVTKQLKELPEIIYTGNVAAMKRIEERAEGGGTGAASVLDIGAATPLEDAWRALLAHWPALHEMWLRFASPPIRHAGTMGGNLANGSPIGDSAPVLMALDARLRLRGGERRRTLALREFYTGYMRNRLEPGEFIEAIEVPLPHAGQAVRAYKISKRFDSDISAVSAGLALTLEGGRVVGARFVFGGMAAVVAHAAQAEAAVLGRGWDEAAARAAVDALAGDFTPLSDMRASAAYRMRVARNLIWRFWLETRAQSPLPADALSVWSVMTHEPVPACAAPGATTLRPA
jgi:xanthine dehydrogenase small subunit